MNAVDRPSRFPRVLLVGGAVPAGEVLAVATTATRRLGAWGAVAVTATERGALLEALAGIDEGVPVVCAWQGAHPGLVPGVFLFVTPAAASAGEALPAALRGEIDRNVTVAGDPACAGLDDLSFDTREGRICLRRAATAVVLAGGRSARMGRDKARIPFDDRPLLAAVLERLRPHFDELLVSARRAEDYAGFGVPVVADQVLDGGPLVGIASALAAARHDDCFVCAVDNPAVDLDLALGMLRAAPGWDAVVPRTAAGAEPLFAVYRRALLPVVAAALSAGQRAPRQLLDRCRTRWFELAPDEAIPNLNTEAELAAYLGRGPSSSP